MSASPNAEYGGRYSDPNGPVYPHEFNRPCQCRPDDHRSDCRYWNVPACEDCGAMDVKLRSRPLYQSAPLALCEDCWATWENYDK